MFVKLRYTTANGETFSQEFTSAVAAVEAMEALSKTTRAELLDAADNLVGGTFVRLGRGRVKPIFSQWYDKEALGLERPSFFVADGPVRRV